MKLRRRGVRVRLTLWYTTALAVTVLALSSGVYTVIRTTLLREVGRQLDRAVAVPQTVIREDPGELANPHELNKIEDFGLMSFFHVAVDGEVLVETAHWRQAQLGRTLERSYPNWPSPWISPGGRSFHLRVKKTQLHGHAVEVAVAVDAEPTRRALRSLRMALLIGFPCALVLAVIGGYFVAGRVLSPLGEMATKAQEISAEQLSERLPIDNRGDELGRLAVAFNETLARLECSFEQLRRFTADASHELRTPLTALRSVGEVGLQEAGGASAYRDVIGSMLEETDRLTGLVDALLTLARADSGQARLAVEPVDLVNLAEAVREDLSVLAEEKNQSLSVETSGSVVAAVDSSILRQALINIVDNAIKYTPAGGGILITVEQAVGDVAAIAVRDDGPGIQAEDRERVFERFYRADRGRWTGVGGAGLGLAIARWAAEIHGGKLELEADEGQGCTFRLTVRTSPGGAVGPRHQRADGRLSDPS